MTRGMDHYLRDEKPNINMCPLCGGPADNGHDREYPPNPYVCTVCTLKREAFMAGYEHAATGHTSPEQGFKDFLARPDAG